MDDTRTVIPTRMPGWYGIGTRNGFPIIPCTKWVYQGRTGHECESSFSSGRKDAARRIAKRRAASRDIIAGNGADWAAIIRCSGSVAIAKSILTHQYFWSVERFWLQRWVPCVQRRAMHEGLILETVGIGFQLLRRTHVTPRLALAASVQTHCNRLHVCKHGFDNLCASLQSRHEPAS